MSSNHNQRWLNHPLETLCILAMLTASNVHICLSQPMSYDILSHSYTAEARSSIDSSLGQHTETTIPESATETSVQNITISHTPFTVSFETTQQNTDRDETQTEDAQNSDTSHDLFPTSSVINEVTTESHSEVFATFTTNSNLPTAEGSSLSPGTEMYSPGESMEPQTESTSTAVIEKSTSSGTLETAQNSDTSHYLFPTSSVINEVTTESHSEVFATVTTNSNLPTAEGSSLSPGTEMYSPGESMEPQTESTSTAVIEKSTSSGTLETAQNSDTSHDLFPTSSVINEVTTESHSEVFATFTTNSNLPTAEGSSLSPGTEMYSPGESMEPQTESTSTAVIEKSTSSGTVEEGTLTTRTISTSPELPTTSSMEPEDSGSRQTELTSITPSTEHAPEMTTNKDVHLSDQSTQTTTTTPTTPTAVVTTMLTSYTTQVEDETSTATPPPQPPTTTITAEAVTTAQLPASTRPPRAPPQQKPPNNPGEKQEEIPLSMVLDIEWDSSLAEDEILGNSVKMACQESFEPAPGFNSCAFSKFSEVTSSQQTKRIRRSAADRPTRAEYIIGIDILRSMREATDYIRGTGLNTLVNKTISGSIEIDEDATRAATNASIEIFLEEFSSQEGCRNELSCDDCYGCGVDLDSLSYRCSIEGCASPRVCKLSDSASDPMLQTSCVCGSPYLPVGSSCVHEGLIIGLSVGIVGAVLIGLLIAVIFLVVTRSPSSKDEHLLRRDDSYVGLFSPPAPTAHAAPPPPAAVAAFNAGFSIAESSTSTTNNNYQESSSKGVTADDIVLAPIDDKPVATSSGKSNMYEMEPLPDYDYPTTFGTFRDEENATGSSVAEINFSPNLSNIDTQRSYVIKRPTATVSQPRAKFEVQDEVVSYF